MENADTAVVEKYRKYFREGYNPYEIDTDPLRQLIEKYTGKGVMSSCEGMS